MQNKPKVLVIIGPTASGKTALSLAIANKLKKKFSKHVEIISADSRQVYKHIPVTTAQPGPEELRQFRHHFINEFELNEDFNAGEFGIRARKLISDIFDSGKIPVIVGGSGLYVHSLVYGLFENEGNSSSELKLQQEKIRSVLYKREEKEGIESLTEELRKIDPETLEKMENITSRRVVRALEVYYATGIPISVHRSKKIDIEFEPVLIGINRNRDELYERINKRTELMLNGGMIDEIRNLKEKGLHYRTVNSLNTVGAKEVFDYLEGNTALDKMKELIKQNTRRFAKRQLTWFRKDNNIAWVNPDATEFPDFEDLKY